MKITYNEIEDGDKVTLLKGSVHDHGGNEIIILSRYLEKEISKDYGNGDVLVFDSLGHSAKFVDGIFTAMIMK